jgi:hypothetical protein
MEGRNFDYGHQKSDSKEGQMARRALLTMAKDLYNLYMTLNDHDDLPEWCHYKLATSRKDLSDIADYLTSKVMKMCVDKKMSTEDLRLEIANSMTNGVLEEGFFDFLSKKKPKLSTSASLHKDSRALNSIDDPALKVLMILKRVSSIYEMYIEPYYSEFLMNKDLGKNYGENRMSMHKSLANAITSSDDYGLQMFLKAALVLGKESKNLSSARKKPQKKRSIKNLFGILENSSIDMTIQGLSELQALTIAYSNDIAKFLASIYRGGNINMDEVFKEYDKSQINQEIKKITSNISKLNHLVKTYADSNKKDDYENDDTLNY